MTKTYDYNLILTEVQKYFKPKYYKMLKEMDEDKLMSLWYVLHGLINNNKQTE